MEMLVLIYMQSVKDALDQVIEYLRENEKRLEARRLAMQLLDSRIDGIENELRRMRG